MTWAKTLLVVLGTVLAVEGVRLVGNVYQPPTSRTVVVREAAAPPRTPLVDPNVAGLRSRVADLEQRTADSGAVVEVTEDADAPARPGPPSPAERHAELETYLANEHKDGSWSYAQEAAIAEAFSADEFAGNQLVEADCRATLCRIVVSHEDDDARERFMSNVPFAQPFINAQGILDPSDGTTNTVLYASRPGTRLVAGDRRN